MAHWASAESMFGSSPMAPSYSANSAPTQAMASADIAPGWRALIDPANPLVWAGILLAITAGLIGASGKAHAGKAAISVSV